MTPKKAEVKNVHMLYQKCDGLTTGEETEDRMPSVCQQAYAMDT
jgi:hypothetical protein